MDRKPFLVLLVLLVHPEIRLLCVKTCCNSVVIWYKLRQISGGHGGHTPGIKG